MLLISYDISDNKLRTRFSKFLSKFGYRLQYSVFKIKNSDRILENITAKIDGYFAKKFKQTDSVYIFNFNESSIIAKYGYAINNDKDLIIVGG